MSSQSETLVYGNATRDLHNLFLRCAGSNGVLTQPQIHNALNAIGLFPTKSQIYEMVHCACECGGRTPVDHITFSEFCVLATELGELYRKKTPAPVPRSQLRLKVVQALEDRRKKRQLTVFLGGSCNPTTWRHDVAIPFLKRHAITFYNPQVSNWKPELMEIEDQAKQSAELLFFVIDNQTRSTASMVEAAFLGGCGRQLVLVIKKFQPPVKVYGETLSSVELEDLDRSHAYLTDLVERQGIPVFTEMDTALSCTAKCIQQMVKVNELTLADGAEQVKYPHLRVADKLMKLKDVFNSVDVANSGRLSRQDLRLAYRTITDEDLSPEMLPVNKDSFTFEDFCCLLAEHRYRRKPLLHRLATGLYRLPNRVLNWLRGYEQRGPAEIELRPRDIFLGGSCGTTTWREDIAIPYLRKHGLSFFNPQLRKWSTRYIPLEAAVKDSCRLLLYVISPDTRGLTSMLEAGHFIGQGCNVVLCVQQMPYGVVVEGDQLTDLAVKDYNRARAYLSDLANRDGVPVFDQVEEAVHCAVTKLKDSAS